VGGQYLGDEAAHGLVVLDRNRANRHWSTYLPGMCVAALGRPYSYQP
jgi:hypothetical protein